MNRENSKPCTPDACIFDKEELMNRVGDDEPLCRAVLAVALKEIPDNIVKLKEGLQENDAKITRMSAHSIKGMAANIAAHGLRDVAYEMENAGRQEDMEKVRSLMPDLEKSLEIFQRLLYDSGLLDEVADK